MKGRSGAARPLGVLRRNRADKGNPKPTFGLDSVLSAYPWPALDRSEAARSLLVCRTSVNRSKLGKAEVNHNLFRSKAGPVVGQSTFQNGNRFAARDEISPNEFGPNSAELAGIRPDLANRLKVGRARPYFSRHRCEFGRFRANRGRSRPTSPDTRSNSKRAKSTSDQCCLCLCPFPPRSEASRPRAKFGEVQPNFGQLRPMCK